MTNSRIVDDMILMRTPSGQHSVLDDLRIGAAHARLLRMVNGYTSLRELVTCLGRGHDWQLVARDLLERKLIVMEPAAQPVDTTPRYADFMRTRNALKLESDALAADDECHRRGPARDPLAGSDE